MAELAEIAGVPVILPSWHEPAQEAALLVEELRAAFRAVVLGRTGAPGAVYGALERAEALARLLALGAALQPLQVMLPGQVGYVQPGEARSHRPGGQES